MNLTNTLNVYKEAILRWGEIPQIAQMFEEMGELMTAISRFYFRKRKDVSKEDIAEEIVDVTIMMEQMKEIFDIRKEVKDIYKLKMKQLHKQLDLGKNFKVDVKTKEEYFR